jgi:hypothetical protein
MADERPVSPAPLANSMFAGGALFRMTKRLKGIGMAASGGRELGLSSPHPHSTDNGRLTIVAAHQSFAGSGDWPDTWPQSEWEMEGQYPQRLNE